MRTLTATRLAVQLTRQPVAVELHTDEVAADAIALARAAWRIRAALEHQTDPRKPLAVALAVADKYNAELIDNRDVDGMVLGLRFRSPTFVSGFRNLFFVS